MPRPLDGLCEQLLHPDGVGRHRELEAYAESARGISDHLADFVGDPTGMAVALLSSAPPVLPDEELVVLPQVPEMTPRETARASAPATPADPPLRRLPDPGDDHDGAAVDTGAIAPAITDRPTEAGLPIFGPDGDDVSWLERRTTAPPPPPPFEEPPERPLFAPEPADGGPARTPRAGRCPGRHRPPARRVLAVGHRHRPRRTGGRARDRARGLGSGDLVAGQDEAVPGRSSFRVAGVLLAVLLLAVAIVVAINVGRGRGVLGGQDSTRRPSARPPRTGGEAHRGRGDHRRRGGRLRPPRRRSRERRRRRRSRRRRPGHGVDDPGLLGPARARPGSLKTGVGLLLDLGTSQQVTAVDLTLQAAPTDVSLYVTDDAPAGVDGLEPVGTTTVRGNGATVTGTVEPTTPVKGQYVVVWLTRLPADGSLFRGRVAEVVVRGE